MTDEEFMGRWFSRVTKPQLAQYNQRMNDAAPYRNSPRWERERAAAQNEFHHSVANARELYELAMSELIALGEITEETNYSLTQFEVGNVMQQEAAE